MLTFGNKIRMCKIPRIITRAAFRNFILSVYSSIGTGTVFQILAVVHCLVPDYAPPTSLIDKLKWRELMLYRKI